MTPQIIILLSSVAVSAATGGWLAKLYYTAEISDMRADKAAAAVEATRKNRKIELLGIELAGVVSERDAARNKALDVQFHTITERVIEYVKSDAPKCSLDSEWVRIYNESADPGGVPEDSDSSGGTDVAARETGADTAIIHITSNNEKCAINANRLLGLQEWVDGLKTL